VHSHYQRRVTDLPLLGRIVQLMVIAAASAATPSCAGGKSSPNASLTVFWLPRRDARTFNEGLENATNTVGFIPGGGNGRLWRKAVVEVCVKGLLGPLAGPSPKFPSMGWTSIVVPPFA
jgi:hypothetical protein